MINKFKPGDIALIIGCDHPPSNIGRTCELVTFLTHGDVVPNPNNPSVKAEYLDEGVRRWLVRGDHIQNDSEDPIDIGLDVILPEHLMLLRGDFEPDKQKSNLEDVCA